MLLQTYKSSWRDDFNVISNLIKEALQELNISIEHVGSTSVSGLASKPIIDIDVVFYEEAEFGSIKGRLEKLGYYHNGNQDIPDREVFKRSNSAPKHTVLDFIKHHLYVCPVHSDELQRHILFRDYLMAHNEARILYQTLKYEIAHESNQDRKKYAELKELKAADFINEIIKKAKQEMIIKPDAFTKN